MELNASNLLLRLLLVLEALFVLPPLLVQFTLLLFLVLLLLLPEPLSFRGGPGLVLDTLCLQPLAFLGLQRFLSFAFLGLQRLLLGFVLLVYQPLLLGLLGGLFLQLKQESGRCDF